MSLPSLAALSLHDEETGGLDAEPDVDFETDALLGCDLIATDAQKTDTFETRFEEYVAKLGSGNVRYDLYYYGFQQAPSKRAFQTKRWPLKDRRNKRTRVLIGVLYKEDNKFSYSVSYRLNPANPDKLEKLETPAKNGNNKVDFMKTYLRGMRSLGFFSRPSDRPYYYSAVRYVEKPL